MDLQYYYLKIPVRILFLSKSFLYVLIDKEARDWPKESRFYMPIGTRSLVFSHMLCSVQRLFVPCVRLSVNRQWFWMEMKQYWKRNWSRFESSPTCRTCLDIALLRSRKTYQGVLEKGWELISLHQLSVSYWHCQWKFPELIRFLCQRR